ncbi:MAG: PEGA domain-containing protein, partial [Sandaracinaceae bacterium]|nr:PEGA domain-containing protein [Sandaracinaceae bacterium]
RPRAEPRPAVQGTAYLNLITLPWASVSINGRSFGNTPFVRREIPAGSLTIVLRREGTGPARTLRLRAEPGQTLSQRMEL